MARMRTLHSKTRPGRRTTRPTGHKKEFYGLGLTPNTWPSCSLDPCAQISSPLIKRVAKVDSTFVKDVEFEPRASADVELQLNSSPVLSAIQTMSFIEMKGESHARVFLLQFMNMHEPVRDSVTSF